MVGILTSKPVNNKESDKTAWMYRLMGLALDFFIYQAGFISYDIAGWLDATQRKYLVQHDKSSCR